MAAMGGMDVFHTVGVASLAVAGGSVVLTGLLLISRRDVAARIADVVRGRKPSAPHAQRRMRHPQGLARRSAAAIRLRLVAMRVICSMLLSLVSHWDLSDVTAFPEALGDSRKRRALLEIYEGPLRQTDSQLLRITNKVRDAEAGLRIVTKNQTGGKEKLQ